MDDADDPALRQELDHHYDDKYPVLCQAAAEPATLDRRDEV